MAVTTSEDTGLLLALNAISTGYCIGEPGRLYRVWPGQLTASRASDSERRAVLRLIGARAEALRDGAADRRVDHQAEATSVDSIPDV